MGTLKVRHWDGDAGGLTKHDRQPCDFEAYVPDPLLGRTVVLDGAVSARVAEAEKAIAKLQSETASLLNTEAIARLLLRAESVASSRIEGLEIGPRKLLRAQAARELGEEPRDVTAIEVLNNIDAMLRGIERVGREGQRLTLDVLLDVHRQLLANTRLAHHAGVVRTQQNWVGGSSYTPKNADFVPPPAEDVGRLLEDLCAFCNTDELSPVVQAALAHAQFETIHPFADGNGRTGRALIHLILRKRGLVQTVLPPVSLVLATATKDYIDGLTATCYTGSSGSAAANAGTNLWVERFATACLRAVGDVRLFQAQADKLRAAWRKKLGKVRANSATELLLNHLLSTPIVTVKTAAAVIQRTFPATNNAIAVLENAGVLKQINLGKRNRAFEAPEVIAAFTSLERRLGSPAGDTRVAKPSRPGPRKAMLKSVHHIAIIVSDYERSKRFYTHVLGMRIVRENYRSERESYKLDLSISDRTDVQLELFSFPDAPLRVSRPEACGARHLCFVVDSLDEALQTLRAHGVEHEAPRIDEYTQERFVFFADPDGLPIELKQAV